MRGLLDENLAGSCAAEKSGLASRLQSVGLVAAVAEHGPSDIGTHHHMDDHRKYAYRYLLYCAMLDIRPLAWLPYKGQWFNPFFWTRHIRRVRALGELADWLHNLAAFSQQDFAGFDERLFWDEFERLRARHPEFQKYRSEFQNALAESQTGRWPSAAEQQRRDA
ncbi:MAG: hypothetical protein ACKV0T_30720 [Planctomycetales bacterium]